MFKRIFVSTILAASVFVVGCNQANAPSLDGAKVVLSGMVTAVAILDSVCAQTAAETKDLQLAKDCATAYDQTRAALTKAQVALDNNDKSFVCAVALAEQALEGFAQVYEAKSGPLPESVLIAESLGRAFGAQCVK